MTAKVVVFLITLVLNIAIGVVVFFFMLLTMNGFSESDANNGFVTFIFLASLVSLIMAALAVVTTSLLSKRGFGAVSSALIGIGSFTVVGLVLKVVCSIIGVLVADFVRTNY
ncbi:MAG TPA: hypothetical protein PLK77_00185 [Pyrinomonadaceae bacterium]|nr:hypothetical protein [Pyrinomonadaceae bacterium]